MSAVVSDPSPLHYLVEWEAIEILAALFQEILIPPTVHRELQHQKTPPRVRAWANSLPAWVKVQAPSVLDNFLNVDEGEKEAICLALEVNAVAILMDDSQRPRRSRALRIARSRHYRFTGRGGGTRLGGFYRHHPALATDQRPAG